MGIIEKAASRLPQADRTTPAHPQASHALPAQALSSGRPGEPERLTSKQVELDLPRLQATGMVTPDAGRSSIAEEFRAIKRDLITRAFENEGPAGKPNNLIMVTSSLPGEGKTFCALNLAISIAIELDHTVLLVDADVARPAILQALGLAPERGLMDLLLDPHLDVADVMLRTNVDGLSLLPAGSNHRHATELLASQSMSKLLFDLARRYPDRIVIFDSPPLLLTSEARVLAAQMGQIAMVVEGDRTAQNTLKTALRQLANCQHVNLIYNKAKPFVGNERYGYYYG